MQWLEYDVKVRRLVHAKLRFFVLTLSTGFQRRATPQEQGKAKEGTVRGRF